MGRPKPFSARRRAAGAAKYAVLTAIGIGLLFPLLYALYSSFQSPSDYRKLVDLDRLGLDNYRQVMSLVPLARWYFNTIVMTAAILIGNFLVNTPAGYALARLRFRGRRPIFAVILAIMMVPLQAYLIPLYIMLAQLKWLNSYASLVVPFVTYTFYIFLMRQFFLTLPREYDDAAEVDGLGKLGVFFRIGLPLAGPGIVTQAVLGFTATWNSFLIPVTMTNDKDMFVLTVGLNTLKSQYYDFPTTTMAGVVLLTLPVVAVFIAFQKHIVPSLATTGIKG